MSGKLWIIGLGPGADDLVLPRAAAALAGASDVLGYGPYVARVPKRPGQRRHLTDNREELSRAAHALELAARGASVAVVSAGDAGVFGMAAAVFEAIEAGDPSLRQIDVEVVPGLSAVLAVAARLGAPCGNDFCVLSLSDNLKPWEVILKRLEAAAGAGFTLALYNPVSRTRPWQLDAAFDLLRQVLPGTVPVIFAAAVSRADEAVRVVPLGEARSDYADMRTLVMIGTEETRTIERSEGPPWLYTPRSIGRLEAK